MDEKDSENLSTAEQELLLDFVEWVGQFDRQILDRQTIEGHPDEVGLQEALEFIIPMLSDEASEFDAQIFRLYRLKQEIQSGPVFEYEMEDELPPEAEVTPEELNRFLKKEELEEFFALVGQMIERLSIELVIEEVVADTRRSKSVRKTVERKSQREREWLLHVTGVISDGEKGEIRRAYDLRSSLVHESDESGSFLEKVNVPNDVNRAKDAIEILHDHLHGIELKHRFGDLIA